MEISAQPQPVGPKPPAPVHPAELAARLDELLFCLLRLLAARPHRLGRFALPFWAIFSRARQRLARVFARLIAGQPERPSRPRTTPRRGGPAPAYLPRHHTWLIRALGYELVGFASAISHVLEDRAVQELLATSPAAVRILRPLCRRLSIALPPRLTPEPALPATPARPAASYPPAPPAPKRRGRAPLAPEFAFQPT